MSEYSALLQPFQLSPTLWLVPLLPLLLSLGLLVLAEMRPEQASRAGRLFLLLAALNGALHCGQLFWQKPAAPLLSMPLTPLRIGSLELGWVFQLDALSAALVLVVSLCALALGAFSAEVTPAKLAGLLLMQAGGLGMALGDGVFTSACGLALVVLGAGFGGREASPAGRRLLLGGVSVAALLGGISVLSWGMAGAWSEGYVYTPDFRARLLAVQSQTAEADDKEKSGGVLRMLAVPGATLKAGGAELCAVDAEGNRGGLGSLGAKCRVRAVTPFSGLPLPNALHDIVVDAGPGTPRQLVEKVRIAPGTITSVELTGQSLNYRELGSQLRIRDESGVHVVRAELSKKQLGALSLSDAAALPVAFSVAALLGLAALGIWRRGDETLALLAAVALGGGAVLLSERLGFLWSQASLGASALALLSVLMALACCLAALHLRSPARAAAMLVAAQAALAVLGAALGSVQSGAFYFAVAALAVVVLLLARGSRAARFAALAFSAAPLAGVGVFFARDALLAGLLQSDNARFFPGAVGFAGALVVCTASSYAAYQLLYRAERSSASEANDSWLSGLALFAGLAGLVAWPTQLLQGKLDSPPVFAPFVSNAGLPLDDRATQLEPGLRLALLAASTLLPMLGFWLARQQAGRAPGLTLLRTLEALGQRSSNQLGATVQRLAALLGRVEALAGGVTEAELSFEADPLEQTTPREPTARPVAATPKKASGRIEPREIAKPNNKLGAKKQKKRDGKPRKKRRSS